MDTILITVDALRADHLPAYGYDRETMPVVDRLLDDGGVRFENAFSNGTHTGISVPSLLTSRYLADDPAKGGPTVASALPGDVTAIGVHSNTYFATRIGRPAGFDAFEDFGVADSDDEKVRSGPQRLFRKTMDAVRPTVERLGIRDLAESVQERVFPSRLIHESTTYETAETTTDRALELVSEVEGDVFLWVHYMDPHRPFCMHVEDPVFTDEDLSGDEIHDLMSRAGIRPETITDDQRQLLIDLYDSELRYTSEQVERLVEGLRERGHWDDAQVVLTADHGEEFGEHGYYFHRNRPYDELIHVPLVVRGPETDGRVVAEQRELLDVGPTICGAHGVDPPEGFLGRDLFEGEDRRVIATGSFRDSAAVVGARWDGWKYIEAGDETELYDLSADPGERDDVSASNGDRLATFRRAIPERLYGEDRSAVQATANEDVNERLSDLGYLE